MQKCKRTEIQKMQKYRFISQEKAVKASGSIFLDLIRPLHFTIILSPGIKNFTSKKKTLKNSYVSDFKEWHNQPFVPNSPILLFLCLLLPRKYNFDTALKSYIISMPACVCLCAMEVRV